VASVTEKESPVVKEKAKKNKKSKKRQIDEVEAAETVQTVDETPFDSTSLPRLSTRRSCLRSRGS
jgi:hypothetical protein